MKRAIALVLLSLVLLSACGSPVPTPTAALAATETPAATPSPTAEPTPEPTPTPTEEPTPTPTPEPTPTPLPPSMTTGLPSGKVYKPICVMIQNDPHARAQTAGLGQADIVYEVLENGDAMTRFVAVFNDFLPERVCSIRSCRVYYVDIASEFKGALCFFGGPPEKVGEGSINAKVNKALRDKLLVLGANGLNPPWNKYYKRDSKYPAPHNVYININDIAALLKDPIEPVSHFQFNAGAAYSGKDVTKIEVTFNKRIINARFVYDAATGLYNRSQESDDSIPMVDANTGKQITVKNVIVQYAKETYFKNSGVRLNNFTMTGTGEADIFVAGKHVKATWKRPKLTDITKYYDESGNEVQLLPGNTWVEVVPSNRNVPVKFS